MKQQLDIILPAYKPKGAWLERVEYMLYSLEQRYASSGLCFRIIISPDGSWSYYDSDTRGKIEALAQRYPIQVLHSDRNRGKGFAVRSGVLLATAEYILYTDYDFPFEDHSYYDVIDTLLAGADIVVGSRGKGYLQQLPSFRYFLSRSSQFLNRLLFRLPCCESQGGVKGLNRKGRDALLDTTIRSFLFDSEFIARATRLGLDIRSVQTPVRQEVKLSSMGWRVFLREAVRIPRVIWVRWFS